MKNTLSPFSHTLVTTKTSKNVFHYGAKSWNRTNHTRFFRPVLYQLSYLGI